MKLWRRTLPVVLCFIVGFLIILSSYSPHEVSKEFQKKMSNWLLIVSGFAFAIGLSSFLLVHVNKVKRQVPGWGYSAVALFCLTVTAFFGLWMGKEKGTPVGWIYTNMQAPMAGTMFSMLAFFIASAAYKAFRAKTVEATLLLAAGFIVMLGQIPFGAMVSGGVIPAVSEWILLNPALAAQRGILLGVGLAMVATSLRIILGIERSYLGGGD